MPDPNIKQDILRLENELQALKNKEREQIDAELNETETIAAEFEVPTGESCSKIIEHSTKACPYIAYSSGNRGAGYYYCGLFLEQLERAGYSGFDGQGFHIWHKCDKCKSARLNAPRAAMAL